MNELARIFNTALVSSKGAKQRDHSSELFQVMETPAFQMILHAVRSLARGQGVTEREAAERLIETFRKVDQLWTDYVFQEGVEKLRIQQPQVRPSFEARNPSGFQPGPSGP